MSSIASYGTIIEAGLKSIADPYDLKLIQQITDLWFHEDTPIHILEAIAKMPNFDINIKNSNNNNALYFAAYRCKLSHVKFLLSLPEIDVNAKCHFEETALHVTNSPEIASLLIEAVANVNAESNTGVTPIHRTRNLDKTNVLIKAGADVTRKDRNGNTALHNVTKLEIAAELIAAGADVNATNNDGNTPIMMKKPYCMLSFLTKAGANLAHKNNNGKTIYDLLSEQEHHWLGTKVQKCKNIVIDFTEEERVNLILDLATGLSRNNKTEIIQEILKHY